MGAQLFVNNFSSSLGASATDIATTLTLATGAGASLPTPSGGDYFYMTLVGLDVNANENLWEIVKCTSRASDVCTVVRGQDGTTGVAWGSGSRIEARINKATMEGREALSNKDASGGYAGLTLLKLNLKNAADTFMNFLTNATTAARTWIMPDKDGTVAMTSDIGTAGALASDTDGALAANSDARIATQKAVKTYVDGAVTGLFDFKTGTDCSSNPNYPAASKGDAYAVTVAGKIGGASGLSVDIGDLIVASADNAGGTQAAVGASWVIFEHNLVGALLRDNNLADVANAATARANLGAAALGGIWSQQFEAYNLSIAGDSGGGFLSINHQSSPPAAPISNTRLFFDLSGSLSLIRDSGYVTKFANSNTASRTYTFPDESISLGDKAGSSSQAFAVSTLVGSDTTDATSSTAAAVKTAGGLGVAKKLYVGTDATIGDGSASLSRNLFIRGGSDSGKGGFINLYRGAAFTGGIGHSGAWNGFASSNTAITANTGLGIDFFVNGAGTAAAALDVAGVFSAAGFKLSALQTAPASAAAAGTTGTIIIDASHIYICTATNTWKRVAIATW